jgi:hypothetical protein
MARGVHWLRIKLMVRGFSAILPLLPLRFSAVGNAAGIPQIFVYYYPLIYL